MSRVKGSIGSRAMVSVFTGCLAALAGAAVLLAAGDGGRQAPGAAPHPLAGTSWQLVKFEGGDGTVLTPDDRSKYTLQFDAKGAVAARIDCNRGRGTWTSSGPSQLQFGPLALTRAFCGPPSMHDQIVKQWGNVRSYVMRDGHLFLSLMADGGTYEFEPSGVQSGSPRSPIAPKGPTMWTCAQGTATSAALRVTFYATEPGLVLLERDGVTKPAFQTKSASGARYEGDGVLFWEARGEARLVWMGVESMCKLD